MQKLSGLFKRNSGFDEQRSGALKKKTLLCSANAAAISIGIHLLLVFFAGSIVLIKYVQKREAAFAGQNIERPKLERRQLQMPVKVQKLQKRSSRPKVTSRMASASQTAIALPDMPKLGGGAAGQSGFNRAGVTGERDLKSLGAAGNLGFGISGVNFFGTKSKGEKLVFAVEASKDMMDDKKGGFYTYQFVKDRLCRMVDGMNSATLFNVLVYCSDPVDYKDRTMMFRPQLVPATPENKAALKAWLVPINKDQESIARIKDIGTPYTPNVQYDSVIKDEAVGWMKAVQAAMEQQADNIFVLCSGFGSHLLSEQRRTELFGIKFADKKKWLESKGWTEERIAEQVKKVAEIDEKAKKILEKENADRAKKGLPPKVVPSWWSYVTQELKMTYPEGPPDMTGAAGGRWSYTQEEMVDHLTEVYKYNYLPKKLEKPKVNMVNLIAADGATQSDSVTGLSKIAQAFGGKVEFLRGAKSIEMLTKYNPDMDKD